MIENTDDFFEQFTKAGPERDRHGNPILLGLDGERHVYTRTSYMSDYIVEAANVGLHIWEMRHLARAMGMSPDLCLLAAVETYNTGLGMTDVGENRASGRRLDEISTRAVDRAMIHEKADYGTAVHAITEPKNTQPVPAVLIADVESWYEATKGMEILETETFGCNDEVMAAGTADHLVRVWLPGYGKVILDKKTGKIKPHENAIQLAIYARSDRYDWDTDERTPPPDDVNTSVGIVARVEAGKGRTRLYRVNLDYGWEMAKVAAAIRDFRALRKDDLMEDLAIPTIDNGAEQHILATISEATTREDMLAIYDRFPRLFKARPHLAEHVKAQLTALGLEVKS